MTRAVWNGAIIAESDTVVPLESYVYFPEAAVNKSFLQPSDHHSVCPWKGTASYYDVVVGGKINKEVAWYYPSSSPAAKRITGHIAFWRGVTIER